MAKTLKVKSANDAYVLEVGLCNYIKYASKQINWLKKEHSDCSAVTIEDYTAKIRAAKALLAQLRNF